MNKNKSNKKDKIISLILFVIFIILVVVFFKIPSERVVNKKVTREEYKNIIYDEVYNEINQVENAKNKLHENEDKENENQEFENQENVENISEKDLFENIDQTLKMNTDM